MLGPFSKDLFTLQWHDGRMVNALPCALTLAMCLGVGLRCGRPEAGQEVVARPVGEPL